MKKTNEQKNNLIKYFNIKKNKKNKINNKIEFIKNDIEISKSSLELLINNSDFSIELESNNNTITLLEEENNSLNNIPILLKDNKINVSPFFEDINNNNKSELESNSININNYINEYDSIQNSLTEITSSINKKYEDKFTFLNPSFDKMKISHNEKNSDKTTLYIPSSIFEKFTPFEKQYWEIKKEYFDVIIFFKKGKFYEMFSNDAFIANREFGLRLAGIKENKEDNHYNLRGGMPMAGIPESQFDVYASKFLKKGYKVARVEQKETQISKQIREKNSNNKNKKEIIKREIKEILTIGTLNNYNLINNYEISNLCSLITFENNNSLIVIILIYNSIKNEIIYKIFKDDKSFYKLRTILIKYSIKEIISDVLIKPYQTVLPKKRGRNLLIDEYYNLLEISYKKYYNKEINNIEYKNLTKAYCNLFNYLDYLHKKYKNIKINILNNKNREFMSLNAISIENLNIKTEFLNKFNNCKTMSGKRLFEFWVLNPLYNSIEIKKRHLIIKRLINYSIDSLKLNELKDLEKLIGKLNGVYKIIDLFKLINGIEISLNFIKEPIFEIINQNIKIKKTCKCEDNITLLSEEITLLSEERNFKILSNFLIEFKKKYKITEDSIERLKMTKNQIEILNKIENMKILFNKYLKEEEEKLNINLKFTNHGKDPFLLQIEKNDLKKLKNNKYFSNYYQLCYSSIKIEKFYTIELKKMVFEYKELLEQINQIENIILFEAVDSIFLNKNIITNIINLNYKISEVDCYINITNYYISNKLILCFPEFICNECNNNSPFIEAIDLINPIHEDYISNTFSLKNTLMILTGPNMAGKSTLLRTIGLNTILSQIGFPVFSKTYKTILFDKLFIRIGSSDNLLKGESSFKIEMLETANFLNKSTKNSLILVDELGRGTSTKDGESICKSVIDFLLEKESIVIFSTHYYKMVKYMDIKYNNRIRVSHMKYLIEDEKIIFLFKLIDGICLDSHGIYLAKKAGLPNKLINEIILFKEKIMK